jgi:hypothetical protein
MDKGNPEFEPIEKDEKSKKNYFCVSCGGVVMQTALFKIEGIILERYCDTCSSKLHKREFG